MEEITENFNIKTEKTEETLENLLSQINEENLHKEIDFGEIVGKEEM